MEQEQPSQVAERMLGFHWQTIKQTGEQLQTHLLPIQQQLLFLKAQPLGEQLHMLVFGTHPLPAISGGLTV